MQINGKPLLTVDSVILLFFFFLIMRHTALGCLLKYKCASVIEHTTKLHKFGNFVTINEQILIILLLAKIHNSDFFVYLLFYILCS